MSFVVIAKEELFKRLVVFACVILVFVALLVVYTDNEEMIRHYKPYYLESYLYVAEHSIGSFFEKKPSLPVKTAKSIPVLVYHGMISNPDNVSTSVERFANEMFALKKAGYQTVHIKDFYDYTQGKKTLPDKSFLLTFDDGRKDSYYPADPILAELHYSAVMFMITGTLDSKTNNFHLIKSEADQMIKSGRWDLQTHTYQGHGLIKVDAKGTEGHFYSNKMWLSDKNRLETDQEFRLRIRSDLLRAKSDMKTYFGIDSIGFAFPFNDYARESLNFPGAKKIFDEEIQPIYKMLFYQAEPSRGFATNIYDSKAQLIKRIDVDTNATGKDLLATLDISRQKDLPIDYTTFSQDQNWIRNTGSAHFEFGTMILQSNEESRGSFSFLGGMESLRNFTENVSLGWQNGSDLTLTFRQNQISDYYYVNLYDGGLRVGHFVDGQDVILGQKSLNFTNIHGRHLISLTVSDNKITLIVDGVNLLDQVPYDIKNPTGGIGFEVFDSAPDNAYVKFRSLMVFGNK